MQGESLFPKLILLSGIVLFFVLPFLVINARGDIFSARQQIESLIKAGKLKDAQTQIDKLKADYSQDSNLPEALYWIAGRYRWEHKWEQASKIYRHVVQNYHNSSYSSKANLGIARVEVLSLIVAEDYIGADNAFGKLCVDFSGHPDLPGTLYEVAERYRWVDKYEKAKELHKRIAQNYPDSPYADKAKIGLARADILSLIISRDYDQADIVLDKLIADFSEHPDLPGTLYWIAKSYRWSDRYEKSRELFQRIIQGYPGSPAAGKARQQFKVVVEGMDVFALIESGREQEAQDAINKLLANPADDQIDEISAYTVFLCGDRYYAKGLNKRKQGLKNEAAANFIKAIDIWGRIIQQLPPSKSKALAYYRSGNCYADLGQYDRAVEKYTQLLENFPDYSLAWDIQFRIGRYYQRLKDNNAIDESSADALTKAAYEAILEKYPDCPAAKAAENWVKKHAN